MHHLNTNKQFMIGNMLLAFAVLVVVVIFVYLSLRMSRKEHTTRYYPEVYTITLREGFVGDSITLMVNDSVVFNSLVRTQPLQLEVGRFAEESALMVVDNRTDQLTIFPLSEQGGSYGYEKVDGAVREVRQ